MPGKAKKAIKNPELFAYLADGDTQQLKVLLGKTKELINAVNERGETPLHVAAKKKDFSLVEVLLKYRPDVNALDRENKTPLHLVMLSGSGWSNEAFNCAFTLIKHGAAKSLLVQDSKGYTPLHCAAESGSALVLRCVFDEVPDVVRKGLEKTDIEGRNALHLAARFNYPVVAKMLLDFDVNLQVGVDNTGNTPLHWAAGSGAMDVIYGLLSCDASTLVRNASGITPAYKALYFGHDQVALFLENCTTHEAFINRFIADIKQGVIDMKGEGFQKYLHGIFQKLQKSNADETKPVSNLQDQLAKQFEFDRALNVFVLKKGDPNFLKQLMDEETSSLEKQVEESAAQIEELQRKKQLILNVTEESMDNISLNHAESEMIQRRDGGVSKLDNDEEQHRAQNLANIESHLKIASCEMEYKQKKGRALTVFCQNPGLITYYRDLIIPLEEFFIGAKAISGGAQADQSQIASTAQTVLGIFGDLGTLAPLVGNFVQIFTGWAQQGIAAYDASRQKRKARDISSLVTLSELKQCVETLASQLVKKYEYQLGYLMESENKENKAYIKNIANIAILYVIKKIKKGEINSHENLAETMLDSICQIQDTEISMLWKKIKSHLTIDTNSNNNDWDPIFFYTLPGIKTTNGKFYTSSHHSPEKYGWRMDSEQKAQQLGMRQVTDPMEIQNLTPVFCKAMLGKVIEPPIQTQWASQLVEEIRLLRLNQEQLQKRVATLETEIATLKRTPSSNVGTRNNLFVVGGVVIDQAAAQQSSIVENNK